MNETITQQIGTTDLNGIWYYITYLPKIATEELTRLLNNNGMNVTDRWSSLIILFLSLLIVFLGIKVSKPIIKYILIGLGIIILVGVIIPFW